MRILDLSHVNMGKTRADTTFQFIFCEQHLVDKGITSDLIKYIQEKTFPDIFALSNVSMCLSLKIGESFLNLLNL